MPKNRLKTVMALTAVVLFTAGCAAPQLTARPAGSGASAGKPASQADFSYWATGPWAEDHYFAAPPY